MIISIRGTNGSGKSTIVRKLFEQCGSKPHYGLLGPRNPEANELKIPNCKTPAFVLGSYRIMCGGCDGIQPYELILELIEKYAQRGHVIIEGMIVTSVYGRIGQLMEHWKRDSVFLFLDTPLEECIRRIEARRGKPRDERLIKNVTGKYNTSLRIRDKVVAEKIMTAITVSCDEAPKAIVEMLQKAKWRAISPSQIA